MSKQRNTCLMLAVQLLMVLVFALCAAVCVQAFAAAERSSRQDAQRDRAVLWVQSAAEVVKAAGSWGGDISAALTGQLGGEGDASGWSVWLDETGAPGGEYLLTAQAVEGEAGLGRWQVSCQMADSVLFSVTAAYQTEVEQDG